MLDLLKDLWGFMRVRKKFWLAPIILTMLLLGALICTHTGLRDCTVYLHSVLAA